MPRSAHRRPRPPLDQSSLDELALAYVGRFATTRSKLTAYLSRKLRERGWEGSGAPDLEALAERFDRSGLVDDSAFAVARAQSLGRRGYGEARVRQHLRIAGVEEGDGAAALRLAASERVANALRFAERRRLGPYGAELPDPNRRQKQVAAMVRAGHPLGLALAILSHPPGDLPDPDQLADTFSHTEE